MPEINANAGSGDCTWVASLATNNPSISHNATFDLRPLRVTDPNALSYHVTNGDSITSLHPHTRDYSFAWNLCAPVTAASDPQANGICSKEQVGMALQYLDRPADKALNQEHYRECHVIGSYDPSPSAAANEWHLLNEADPSQGVSIAYPLNDLDASCENGATRSSTIDIKCSRERMAVESAIEAKECSYRLVMRSFHGCPLECPHADKSGLCSGHGICAFDSQLQVPYCKCDQGYSGDSCDNPSSSNIINIINSNGKGGKGGDLLSMDDGSFALGSSASSDGSSSSSSSSNEFMVGKFVVAAILSFFAFFFIRVYRSKRSSGSGSSGGIGIGIGIGHDEEKQVQGLSLSGASSGVLGYGTLSQKDDDF